MIEVMMSVDHRANRLARCERPGSLNHREGARLVLWCLDEQQVVSHLDRNAVVRLARQKPHSRSGLTDHDSRCGRRRSRRCAQFRRRSKVRDVGGIHLNGSQADVGESPSFVQTLYESGWKLQSIEVLPVMEVGLEKH